MELCIIIGMENGKADTEKRMIVPQKVKTEEWGDSAIAFVGLREMRSPRRYCIPVLMDALFTIVKR